MTRMEAVWVQRQNTPVHFARAWVGEAAASHRLALRNQGPTGWRPFGPAVLPETPAS